MSSYKKIGPVTVEVAPGRPAEGDKPGVSATYRNNAATDELPSTVSAIKHHVERSIRRIRSRKLTNNPKPTTYRSMA